MNEWFASWVYRQKRCSFIQLEDRLVGDIRQWCWWCSLQQKKVCMKKDISKLAITRTPSLQNSNKNRMSTVFASLNTWISFTFTHPRTTRVYLFVHEKEELTATLISSDLILGISPWRWSALQHWAITFASNFALNSYTIHTFDPVFESHRNFTGRGRCTKTKETWMASSASLFWTFMLRCYSLRALSTRTETVFIKTETQQKLSQRQNFSSPFVSFLVYFQVIFG